MTIDEPWAAYARLQEQLARTPIGDRAWALDEALDLLVAEQAAGRLVSQERLQHFITNHTSKHRRRRQLLAASMPEMTVAADAPVARLDLKTRLGQCSERDQEVLIAQATGQTVVELSVRYKVPPGTVKSWISRARLKFAA